MAMTVEEIIERTNKLLSLLERVNDFEQKGILSTALANLMRKSIMEQLDILFPEPVSP